MSKNLFQLIKKLSPNEKGYFKKVSKVHSVNNSNAYIRLFDLLDKQTQYDKKKLEMMFGNKKIIAQLPVLSNYLYYLILDTLREFNSGKTVETRLQRQLANAEQLYLKGLYEQARTLINKVRVKAEKGENFLLVLQIYAFEGRLALLEEDIENLKKQVETLNISRNQIIDKYQNYTEYRQLVAQLFYLSKSSGRHLKSEKDQREIDHIMQHPLLSDRKQARSVSALNNFLLIHSYYHDIKKERDISRSIQFNMERLKLLEGNRDYVVQVPSIYLSVLHNLLLNAGEVFDLKLFRSLLEKVKQVNRLLGMKLTPETEKFKTLIYAKYSIFQSFISCDFQEGILFIKGKEQFYYELHKASSEEEALVYCHNLYSLYFGVGDYKQSLFWINRFLQSEQEALRMDLWVHVNWTNIIIHIELQNYDLAASLMQSFNRFLNKHPKEFVFEKTFAKTLKSYINSALNEKQKEQREKLKELKTVLLTYKKSGLVNNVDLVFLLPWVKSRLEDQPFLEVYKRSLKEFSGK
jgi:hypothetical protein